MKKLWNNLILRIQSCLIRLCVRYLQRAFPECSGQPTVLRGTSRLGGVHFGNLSLWDDSGNDGVVFGDVVIHTTTDGVVCGDAVMHAAARRFSPLFSGAECTFSPTSEYSGTVGEAELDDPADRKGECIVADCGVVAADGPAPLPRAEMQVRYQNWRGVERCREIRPVRIFRGRTEWHPEEQWLLEAVDTEDGQTKQFALKDCDFVRR